MFEQVKMYTKNALIKANRHTLWSNTGLNVFIEMFKRVNWYTIVKLNCGYDNIDTIGKQAEIDKQRSEPLESVLKLIAA